MSATSLACLRLLASPSRLVPRRRLGGGRATGFAVDGGMKLIIAAIASLAVALVASAQVPDNDMRCLLVAHGFTAVGKTEAEKKVAELTEAFYLGRISTRMSAAAMQAAMRSQGKGVPVQEAGKIMTTCAAQAERSNRELQAAARALGGRK